MSKPISASPNHASGQRNGTATITERLLLLLLLLLLPLLLLLQHGVSKLERCRYDVGANDIFRQRCPGPSPPLPPPLPPTGNALKMCHGICTAEAEGHLAKDASDEVLSSIRGSVARDLWSWA